MKQSRLTPTIIVLVLSLLVGFSLLAAAYRPSVLLIVVVALILTVFSVLLIRYAVIFDRQMLGKRERLDEKETTE